MATADESSVPDYQSQLRLSNKEYVVVGAGSGIGRQTCHALAQAGARTVVCVDITEDRAAEVAREVAVGVPWSGDITSRTEVDRLAAFADEHLERVDGFVDIVGNAHPADFFDLTDEVWDSQFDIQVRHAYLLAQALGGRMRTTGGGAIVYIGSVSGLYASPISAAYGATKAALMQMVKSLAVDFGRYGIRVNCVAPGCVLTPKVTAKWSKGKRDEMARIVPLGFLGEASDIASVVSFLMSDGSKYVTGVTLPVGGGVDACGAYARSSFPLRSEREM